MAIRVTTRANSELRPAWATLQISAGFKDLMAAKTRNAARVGSRTYPTADEKATKTSATPTPDQIAAHRLLARTLAFSAVAPTEPPTGCPPNSPAARLATPWALKSRLELDRVPSRFGAASATPAPWTTTIAATANAPETTDGVNVASDGS